MDGDACARGLAFTGVAFGLAGASLDLEGVVFRITGVRQTTSESLESESLSISMTVTLRWEEGRADLEDVGTEEEGLGGEGFTGDAITSGWGGFGKTVDGGAEYFVR